MASGGARIETYDVNVTGLDVNHGEDKGGGGEGVETKGGGVGNVETSAEADETRRVSNASQMLKTKEQCERTAWEPGERANKV
jgi:hypothetical protein